MREFSGLNPAGSYELSGSRGVPIFYPEDGCGFRYVGWSGDERAEEFHYEFGIDGAPVVVWSSSSEMEKARVAGGLLMSLEPATDVA